MSGLIAKKAFDAIINDDCAAYAELSENDRIGAYRYGRFPVLSLMYLFNAKRLLKLYENELIKINDYAVQSEPVAAFTAFKDRAGKCLRLYFDEVVSPLEMLLILDEIKRLKRVYPSAKPSQGIKQRLKSIYSIRYGLNLKCESDKIISDRKPLSRRQKKRILSTCLVAVLVAAICVSVPTAAVAFMPKPKENQLDKIDFSSQNEYTLDDDLTLPENYTVEKLNCKINGNGKKLVLKSGATIGTLNGSVSNLTVETDGGKALFDVVSETATVENITVNVNANLALSESSAFVVGTNYGAVRGVTLNVGGKLMAVASEGEDISALSFGGIVQNNYFKNNTVTQTSYLGVVSDCTVNYENFTLSGEASANAAFGGVAGLNYGYVQNCTVSGDIAADTFDLAGVCVNNYGMLSGDRNEASLIQTSGDAGWNPITCGIVSENGNIVENCENRGNIVAKSTCGQFEETQNEPTVSASGIAHISRGNYSTLIIRGCKNYGSVTASAAYRNVYAAGVCVSNNSGIESCENTGDITATAENGNSVYVGGISGLAYGYVVKSLSDCGIYAEGSGRVYAGGIASVTVAEFVYCRAAGKISVRGNDVRVGGILGYGDLATQVYYVYSANVQSCIAENDITAVKTGDAAVYVGGIAGYISEQAFTVNGVTTYYGGSVISSYSLVSGKSDGYFGNLVGGVGLNIHENNSYTVQGVSYPFFDKNFCLENGFSSFGTAVSADGSFASAADKGVEIADAEEIKNSENYKNILAQISGG